ncbi:acyltransferase [Bowmanella denitrificans]|uniref:acyltransferase family protein n=1 Tax=Bowmanella denitrificans TaxID=366582 RepID=UPI0031DC11BF
MLVEKNLTKSESQVLDFLRGSGAFLVLWAHCQQILVNPYWFPHKDLNVEFVWVFYRHIGSFGVMLFFVLSGFLIFLSIVNNWRNSSTGQFNIKKFLVSRMVRLYPPLLVATVISLFGYFLLWYFDLTNSTQYGNRQEIYFAREEIVIKWRDIFGSLFFINNIIDSFKSPTINGPLWSLAAEFWYYIVAALITLLLGNRKNVFALVIVFAFLAYNVNEFWWYGLVVWGAGAFSAAAWNQWEKAWVRFACYILVATFFLLWFYMLLESSSSYYYNNRNKFMFGLFVAPLLPILLSLRRGKAYSSNISILAVAEGSRYAYTLYLIHFPILLLVFAFTNRNVAGDWVFMALQIMLSIAIIIALSKIVAGLVENKMFLKRLAGFIVRQSKGF